MQKGSPQSLRRDLSVALLCGAFVALTGGLCRAALPLYSRFCGAGATAVADARQHTLLRVRFAPDRAALARPPGPAATPSVTVAFAVATEVVGVGRGAVDPGQGAAGTITRRDSFSPQRARAGAAAGRTLRD